MQTETSHTVLDISKDESINDSILTTNEFESETSRLIREVRQQYNDSMLVSEMLRLCSRENFQNIDDKDLAIFYNYIVSCRNEDSSEGIYCDVVEYINSNEIFSQQLIQFLSEVPAESKDVFIEQMANNIIWAQAYCSIGTTNYIDSLSKCIIDRMPKDIFELMYNNDTIIIKEGVKRYVDLF
ncbi:MAG: hypothetical protein K2M68_02645 [Muribaculaceae bacterium]|nr:hypothetical protein [Muribaculaceae bacterium]